MSDVFISYARSTAAEAERIADALRSSGYAVWRDDELPAHRAYADVIEERLRTAKAVLVIWSAEAAKSQWVRAEADFARKAGSLVQLSLDGAAPPLPFDQIQCVDMTAWRGDPAAQAWRVVVGSIAELCQTQPAAVPRRPTAAPTASDKPSIAVLPFDNMSGDPEQGYFSDGITEDIITDLGKVSALRVTARNTVFTFKGHAVDVPTVARQLGVSHVLEGSVRKAGGRVRITAQLIDGASGDHVWAERYDRDLTDIFELQDEISTAIVAALRLKLLPEEKRAIQQRGTTNLEAFNLYLMAREHFVMSNMTDRSKSETVIRLCRRAIELDPNYARAWALLAAGQRMALYAGGQGDNGLAAAERALALDDTLAEAHAARAAVLVAACAHDEGRRELDAALRLDPDSYEANHTSGKLCFAQGRLREAIAFWEKAAAVMEDGFSSVGMLMTCYAAIGDQEGARDAARRTLAVTEKVVAKDPANGSAMSMLVGALAALGEAERAKAWAERAVLVDPDNANMRYNLACALILDLKEVEAGLDMLGPALEQFGRDRLDHTRVDPDLDPVRDHPRFEAMLAAAEARLAGA